LQTTKLEREKPARPPDVA